MGVMTGANTACVDKEVATQALNAELQDKGFLLTSTEDIINWARTGSLHWMTFGLACCAVEMMQAGAWLKSDARFLTDAKNRSILYMILGSESYS